jgi:hypothetical protein
MVPMRAAIALCLLLVLLLPPGCGRRGPGYDAAIVARELEEMLQRPGDFQALYEGYRQTADFKGFLKELRTNLQGSALAIRDPREALGVALELIQRHRLGEILLNDSLLLTHYHADLLIALLALGEGEVAGFFAGLRELTVRALDGNGARPEVVEGVKRGLRALCLRQPFLGASPPYAAQTHEDRLGEVPATVGLARGLLSRGWEIAGFYEEGRAKITRRFNHLQAVIDLVATEGLTALFLQVEQALDGTDRDLKQVADRVEATANYLQEGGWAEEFDFALGSRGIVVLVIREEPTEGLWREIERRAGFLKEPIPILMVYGEEGFKRLNLSETEARELLWALGYSSSP